MGANIHSSGVVIRVNAQNKLLPNFPAVRGYIAFASSFDTSNG
jgi:hypothetical protein